jgi:HlyD family secretion protein
MRPHPVTTVAVACAALLGTACTNPQPAAWSGYVEGDYVYVAAPIGGALAQLPVRRGQMVDAGVSLFVLDDAPERAALAEAAARERSAAAQAADADKGRRREEIAVTQAQLAQARAQATLADSELVRVRQLVAQSFLSPARLDDAVAAQRQARLRVAELEAALRVAQLPARVDTRAAADAQAEAARAAVAQQQWREAQKSQRAPAGGIVADTYFRVGEWVAAGQPVVSLLPPGAVRARFFVPESELATLQLGQAVTLHCDACGAPMAARIDFIAPQAEYTPPVIYSNAQRARLVFMVEARPQDAKDGQRLKPGLPVDVRRAS